MGYGIGLFIIGIAWVAGACHLYILHKAKTVEGYDAAVFFGEGKYKASFAPWFVIPIAVSSWLFIMGILL